MRIAMNSRDLPFLAHHFFNDFIKLFSKENWNTYLEMVNSITQYFHETIIYYVSFYYHICSWIFNQSVFLWSMSSYIRVFSFAFCQCNSFQVFAFVSMEKSFSGHFVLFCFDFLTDLCFGFYSNETIITDDFILECHW